jgi:Ca2+/Na+ antiporter
VKFAKTAGLGFCFLLIAALGSASALADGSPAERQALVIKGQRLSVILRNRAQALSGAEVTEVNQRLDDLLALVGSPVVPPQPALPACGVLNAGIVSGAYYNLRVASGNTVLAGVNSIGELVTKLSELESARVCAAVPQSCAVANAGIIGGAYYNLRLQLGGLDLVGANSIDELVSSFNTLRQGRVCAYAAPSTRCELQGAAIVGGAYYNNTIALGGLVIAGANSIEEATTILGKLRTAALCQ